MSHGERAGDGHGRGRLRRRGLPRSRPNPRVRPIDARGWSGACRGLTPERRIRLNAERSQGWVAMADAVNTVTEADLPAASGASMVPSLRMLAPNLIVAGVFPVVGYAV